MSKTAVIIIVHIAAAALTYVIGSVNGAIITSKYLYRRDIRELGSGNPGLNNFHRVFGARGALLMIVIDVAKTLGPVLLGGWIFSLLGQSSPEHAKYGWLYGRIYAGFFVMLGHSFPVFYGFKGGRAVLAVGILLFSLDWRVSVLGWGIFIIVLAATRYVSLGAIIGVWGYPAALAIFRIGGAPELVLAILSSALLVARHSANIKRLLTGTESKLSFKRNRKDT
ncbi:MAG: glycerol-3-phosphate acyltransferase [Oscillospiraceae bacterium]|jgi:glycerol-3-phosphate acyltransferase PlsY|nr:glycerol-3-phosphate acyltransferase [Oscillospiraceae bacterium]